MAARLTQRRCARAAAPSAVECSDRESALPGRSADQERSRCGSRPGTIEEKVQQLRELEAQGLARAAGQTSTTAWHVVDPPRQRARRRRLRAQRAGRRDERAGRQRHRADPGLRRDPAVQGRDRPDPRARRAEEDSKSRSIRSRTSTSSWRPRRPRQRRLRSIARTCRCIASTSTRSRRPTRSRSKMRALLQWLGSEDVPRTIHPTRIAAQGALSVPARLPVPEAQREGRAAADEPDPAARGLSAGDPAFDRSPALLRRAQDLVRRASPRSINEALDNGVESAIRYWHRELGIVEEDDGVAPPLLARCAHSSIFSHHWHHQSAPTRMRSFMCQQ